LFFLTGLFFFFGTATLCAKTTTFETGKIPLAEIHVATDGSDIDGTGSAGSPYATISRALKDAARGSAIRIHPGRYAFSTSVAGVSGSDQAPIWIGGLPGESKPVFENLNQAFYLTRVRYLILHDIVVQQCTLNGINCDDGGEMANPDATRFVVFRDLEVASIGTGGNQDGLKLSGVDDYFVLDCSFSDSPSSGGSGIDHVGCHKGVIEGNTFSNLGNNAIQCKGGSQDILIRGNYFDNCGQRSINIGGSTGYEFFRPPLSDQTPNFEARNIRIIANVFKGSHSPLAFVGCVDSLAANNTLVDPENWIIRILQETVSDDQYTFLACADNRVINNIVYYDQSQIRTHVNIGDNTDADSFQFSHNLWYAHDNPAQSAPILPVADQDSIQGQDPLFNDPSILPGGLYLNPLSPAVDKGLTIAGIDSADMVGTDRPQGAAWDIGAYEVLSGAPSIPKEVKILNIE
jgi:hypothetical protein